MIAGGSGGGGGGGDGASNYAAGGNVPGGYGGMGGRGGYGASGSGSAGGGGGASSITEASYNPSRTGGNASGATPGAAGAAVESGESAGSAGSANSVNVGGAGGNGASATHTSSATAADFIYVYGGDGGRGGQGGTSVGYNGGDGGNGGSAALTLSGNVDVSGNVYVISGQGGSGAATSVGSGTSGSGGTGGYASLNINGVLRADQVFVFTGGSGDSDGYGSQNPGTGGNVGFFATSLAAREIWLVNNPGNFAFNVGTLDVSSGNTILILSGTATGTAGTAMNGNGVYIGTVRLGNYQLQVNQLFDPGAALINTLQLEGRGTFDDTANPVILGNLAIDGGTLHNGNWSGIIDHAYTTPAITLGAGGATVELNTGEDKTLSRNLIGTGGSLTKTGTGTLTLSGANTTYSTTTVSAGLINFNNANNFGTGNITLNGGGLQWGTGNTTDISAKLNALGANGGIFDTNGNNVTLANALSGAGGLTKTGAGTLTLGGTNIYTGLTTVQSGTLDVSGSSIDNSSGLELYGGSTFIPNTGHTLNNKTLTVRGENANYQGNLSATGATLNFIAPVNISQPMLNVTGNADVSNSVVNVGVSGGTSLPMGTELALLNVTGTLTGAETLTEGSGIVESGVTTLYGLTLAVDPVTGNLLGTVTSGSATEQSKPFSEGYLGGVALLNQSGDAVAGEGMSLAVNSAQSGYGAFATLAGGSLRYDTGSHINLHSATLLAGLSSSFHPAPGKFTLGAFFEYGNGRYDTHNSFTTKVKGDGDLEHYGVGLLGRMDYRETAKGNFYAEGSLRAGRIENDYGSSDIRDHNGRKARYDSKSSYYSAHAGAGHIWKIGAASNFDFYGKYYWTRQDKDKVRLSTGDSIEFKAIDSNRARIGGRYSRTLDVNLKGYAGLAWEHEFDGKARATANGFKIEAPKLKGNTGIAEIGLTLTPTPTRPFSLDLGLQAYTGRYEGVTGSIRAKYRF